MGRANSREEWVKIIKIVTLEEVELKFYSFREKMSKNTENNRTN